ncbi:hypothetical protein BB559_003456 [Furculomyces boomerangus]|uniref:Xylanolytic transcriptional activator regulatory domain-containing protein n=1 Tax=Furculomyces boomerangus TaxID=61424 RepID=A0A2T9YL17_9FUNG|nr:hypothetical protein BB559_003456 [Furculomyces boomerangus]
MNETFNQLFETEMELISMGNKRSFDRGSSEKSATSPTTNSSGFSSSETMVSSQSLTAAGTVRKYLIDPLYYEQRKAVRLRNVKKKKKKMEEINEAISEIEIDTELFQKLLSDRTTFEDFSKNINQINHDITWIPRTEMLPEMTTNDIEKEFSSTRADSFNFEKGAKSRDWPGIPSLEQIEQIIWIVAHSRQMLMIPINIPEVLSSISTNTIPEYFLYSLLALGIRYLFKQKDDNVKEMENCYLEKASYLLKVEKDTKNPTYPWACCLIAGFYSTNCLTALAEQYAGMAIDISMKNKFHLIDQKRRVNVEMPEGSDKEFIRRVWWTCYIMSLMCSEILSTPIRINQQDMAVNLPKNDFFWKYGGKSKMFSSRVALMNHLANRNGMETFETYNYSKFLIKIYYNMGFIANFLNNRWAERSTNKVDDYDKVIHITKVLSSLKNEIEEQSNLQINQTELLNGVGVIGLRNFIKLSFVLYRFQLQIQYYKIRIYFFISEIVRIKGREVPAERVKNAKKECIKAALNQVTLLKWGCENIPFDYWDPFVLFWAFYSSVILMNSKFIYDHEKISAINDGLNIVTKVMLHISAKYPELKIFNEILQSLEFTKLKSHLENETTIILIPLMTDYALTPQDYNPWIVPRYSTFLNPSISHQKNFSNLLLTEYFGII